MSASVHTQGRNIARIMRLFSGLQSCYLNICTWFRFSSSAWNNLNGCRHFLPRKIHRQLLFPVSDSVYYVICWVSRSSSSGILRGLHCLIFTDVSGQYISKLFNPLNPELNPICYLLALLGAPHFLHVSRIRVKLLTFRLLMSYIYGAPILDVSRSHTTTQHSR